MAETQKILDERQKTHGNFRDNAQVSQEIKNIVEQRLRNSGYILPAYILESLDMIIHKISRIAVGNPHEIDHWQDIAGYAELVVRELQKDSEDAPVKSFKE